MVTSIIHDIKQETRTSSIVFSFIYVSRWQLKFQLDRWAGQSYDLILFHACLDLIWVWPCVRACVRSTPFATVIQRTQCVLVPTSTWALLLSLDTGTQLQALAGFSAAAVLHLQRTTATARACTHSHRCTLALCSCSRFIPKRQLFV